MRTIIPLTAALALAICLPQASLAQGKGHDKGGPPGHGQGQGGDEDRGGGKGKGKGQGQGQAFGGGEDRGGGKGQGQARREERGGGPPPTVVVRQEERVRPDHARRNERTVVTVAPQADRRIERVVIVNNGGRGLIAGCPPGLAKRNNGCMPPGQERKLNEARYSWLSRYSTLYGRPDDRYVYRYGDGYLYRYDNRGDSLLGYLPLLGGALGLGSPWPTQYRYEPAPVYYRDYYGLRDPYDYRYADGVIYGVDPRTSSINQVAALVTGQPFTLGQRIPAGYDVYNVPYPYRDRYYDTPQYMYRYNDGYVYQVDPTTQLISAIIQLLV